MSKLSETYKALDDNSKQRYQDEAAKARADHLQKHGEDAMKLGPRSKDKAGKNKQKEEAVSGAKGGRISDDDGTRERPSLDAIPLTPAKGLPHGWKRRIIPRKDQSKKTKADTVWYSPVESYRFKSAAEAKKFQEMTEKTNGDETEAYRLLHPNSKQLKGADAANAAVNDSKKSKKSKKIVAESDSKEDDKEVAAKMSDNENEDPRESKEDTKKSPAEMSDAEVANEDSSKSEEDDYEMSEDEDSSMKEEEEEMPEAWLY